MDKNALYYIAAVLWGVSGLPVEFTASFYSGLGPMLLFAAFRFMFNHLKSR